MIPSITTYVTVPEMTMAILVLWLTLVFTRDSCLLSGHTQFICPFVAFIQQLPPLHVKKLQWPLEV